MRLVGKREGAGKLSFFFKFFNFFWFFLFTSGAYALYTLSFAKGLMAQNPCKFSVQAKKIDAPRRRINRRRAFGDSVELNAAVAQW
ncbi:MAG: hypothetical protein DRP66_11060 [Planctomycetota bacterium]|nr:MAG: hypothetical protein DRP66_11060 [Planctomycetota bacterium]